jgi:hypothetical protein
MWRAVFLLGLLRRLNYCTCNYVLSGDYTVAI